MKIQLPNDVFCIIQTLNKAGYPAFIVGGCVRDSLRGKTPADWDIATGATPEQTMALFPRCIPTGLKHGTVTVMMNKTGFEVTTFRVDGSYEDHRRPDAVVFTKDITEDLSRRDFTMNAIAYHPEIGVVDPFGGQEDIKNDLIRSVGDPLVRFDEDALRMLRAIRFAAQTGFSVCDAIIVAIKERASLISAVSAERIRDELVKILLSDRPAMLELLHETGLLSLILPEVDRCFYVAQNSIYHIYDVGHHTLSVLRNAPMDLTIRLAALLHDIGKPDKKTTDADGKDHFKGHDLVSVTLAEQVLARLRFDNRTKDDVLRLIRFHDRRIPATKTSVRRLAATVGAKYFMPLLELMRADAKGQHPDRLLDTLHYYDEIEKIYNEIIAQNNPLSLADLAISGQDVMALGFEGPAVGKVLKQALNYVLEHPEDNQTKLLTKKIQAGHIKID
ncbi:MAG: CCA tRNA nucleotidyltransferase [Clostridia bacterium]|nr:CCA tRNA nucleotidyltransferase [Clostridia bacterium]